MNWNLIESAPKDGEVVLTDEGSAKYVDRRRWGSPVTNGWYLCTSDGDIPTCADNGMEISSINPKMWMSMPESQQPVSPTMTKNAINTPEPYFTEKARLSLESQGVCLGASPTKLEATLWKRLLLVFAAAERVLSDVDDDRVAEAQDMAILGLRSALVGKTLK